MNRTGGRLVLLVATLLAPPAAGAQDSIPYASARLRTLVAEAAQANRRVPESLTGYEAQLESEIAIGFRDTLGVDRTTQVEQLAARARWQRSGIYELHLVGYRAQLLGPTLSSLSFMRGWTVPALYGNRLRLGLVGDTTRSRSPVLGRAGGGRVRRAGGDARAVVVHPFADDRDRFYRFRGGDTVTVLRSRAREIPVVRVHVEPSGSPDTAALLFQGDVDLDAERREIVRMRGKLVRVEPGRDMGGVTGRGRLVSGVGFIEFVNAEVAGRFWLPVYQRTEMQGFFTPMGDMRSVFRILTQFRGHEANGPAVLAMVPRADSARGDRYVLSRARGDSLGAYDRWEMPIGDANSRVNADDFADLTPPAWSRRGPPRVELSTRRMGELVHFNRVEGLYTGLTAQLRMRDRAPGLVFRATGGWAWAEGTARGAATAEWQRGGRLWTARVERALAVTDELDADVGDGTSLGALLYSQDNQDYLDRRLAAVLVMTGATAEARRRVRLELGVARDAAVGRHQSHGLFGSDTTFRLLRGIDPGSYGRAVLTVELNPRVSSEFLDEGVGATLRWERAEGGLRYDRVDANAVMRRVTGPLVLSGRVSGAMVARKVVPQQLLELGEQEGLTGYEYREFVGDRAALARTVVVWNLPFARSVKPRLGGRLVLPALAPGISVGAEGAWTELASERGRAAALRLLGPFGAAPRATGGIRASVDARVTFLGGAIGLGVAKPVDGFRDRPGGWRFIFTAGQGL